LQVLKISLWLEIKTDFLVKNKLKDRIKKNVGTKVFQSLFRTAGNTIK